jgi:hypothetical protein
MVAALYLWSRGHALYCLGRSKEAVVSLRESALLNPDFMPVHLWLAATYAPLGNRAEANASVAAVQRVNSAVSLVWYGEIVPLSRPRDATCLRRRSAQGWLAGDVRPGIIRRNQLVAVNRDSAMIALQVYGRQNDGTYAANVGQVLATIRNRHR